jgi:hypothetical protein
VINPKQLRELREETERVLKELTEKTLPSRLTFTCETPILSGQYWEYELFIWEGDLDYHQVTCGCFTGSGTLANRTVGINTFFENNDRLFSEFSNAVNAGIFNELIPLLQRAESLVFFDPDTELDVGASLSLNSYVITNDEWTRLLCEESVLIIHINEDRHDQLYIGCQKCERYKIKVSCTGGHMYLQVPFDKAPAFKDYERVERHSTEPYRDYEVALSFAGEDRRYVSSVARTLREKRVRLFYDEYENVTLWGKDLYVHLDEIYRKRARYCVVFLSSHYREKVWTNHERISAQARAFEEHSEYLLPVKLDDTEIPGIRPTIGYIKKLPPKQLADIIYQKINGFIDDLSTL